VEIGTPDAAAIAPEVFQRMEAFRQSFWSKVSFNPGTTMIFTTKATVRTWHVNRATRPWLHPDFRADLEDDVADRLAKDFRFGVIAFHELEIDEFMHIWSEEQFDGIEEQQQRHTDWRNMRRAQRLAAYDAARQNSVFANSSFEEFDAAMRVRLDDLERQDRGRRLGEDFEDADVQKPVGG
jgi:hypothetical protein